MCCVVSSPCHPLFGEGAVLLGHGIGILVALPIEARGLGKRQVPVGELVELAPHVYLLISGMGADRAQEAVCTFHARGLYQIINCGFAGALRQGVRTGELFVPDAVCSAKDRCLLPMDSSWRQELCEQLHSCGQPAVPGRLYSASEVLLNSEQRRAAALASQADLVDMEGYAVVTKAYALGMEPLLLKVILDQYGTRIPSCVAQHVDVWGRPDGRAFVAHLLRYPQECLDLWRLGYALWCALYRLVRLRPALKTFGLATMC